MSGSPGKKPVMLEIDQRIYDRCEQMAKAANVPTGTYIRMLFEAAYSARCRETGDIDLDTAVARVGLLFGTGFDAERIEQSTGLPELIINKIVEGWRTELRRRAPELQRSVTP